LSFNVRGLRDKLEDISLINFALKYDIIILLETFLTDTDYDLVAKYFSSFKIKFISAVRLRDRGRPMGGIVVGLNRNSSVVNSCHIEEESNFVKISYKFADDFVVNIMPVYLNCNFWEVDFGVLSNYVEQEQNTKFIVICDCNARVADEQIIEFDNISENLSKIRKSKVATVNPNGKK